MGDLRHDVLGLTEAGIGALIKLIEQEGVADPHVEAAYRTLCLHRDRLIGTAFRRELGSMGV